MFRCDECKEISKPSEKPVRVVVETRNKIYPMRPQAYDPGGTGTEIVREILVHSTCKDQLKGEPK
jgi:hypothetical protein